MDITCTVYRSCSCSHLSDNGLSSYVSIIFIISAHTLFNPDSDHWHDVLAGAILGTVVAYFSYCQYYPDLASKFCYRPYAPRIDSEDTEMLPTHNRHSSGESHDSEIRISYNNDYGLGRTVPRPDIGQLENVKSVEPYKDSLQLEPRAPISNDAP